MKKKVSELKPGDRFYWKNNVAIVKDICDLPDHFFSNDEDGTMYSLDVEVVGVPNPIFRGAVQVRGTVVVNMVVRISIA